MSARRGHVLLLLMVLLGALALSGLMFTQAVIHRIDDREAEEVRLQAIWLARSALETGVTGSRSVTTPIGEASVRVGGGRAVVELAGATATAEDGQERFEPAP